MSDIYEDLSVFLSEIPAYQDEVIYIDGLPENPIFATSINAFNPIVERIQNSKRAVWVTWGVQIRVRSNTPKDVHNRMEMIQDKMDGETNIYINGVLFQSIFLVQPPVLIIREHPGGQVTYGVSFNVKRRGY